MENSLQEALLASIEGLSKTLPALIAAYYAYRLWHHKAAQDRADAVVKGCLILKHFCSSLSSNLNNNPNVNNVVPIDVLNSHLDSILVTSTISSVFPEVLDIFFRWKSGEYFPIDSNNQYDYQKRLSLLNDTQNKCAVIVEIIRKCSPGKLSTLKLSSL